MVYITEKEEEEEDDEIETVEMEDDIADADEEMVQPDTGKEVHLYRDNYVAFKNIGFF